MNINDVQQLGQLKTLHLTSVYLLLVMPFYLFIIIIIIIWPLVGNKQNFDINITFKFLWHNLLQGIFTSGLLFK